MYTKLMLMSVAGMLVAGCGAIPGATPTTPVPLGRIETGTENEAEVGNVRRRAANVCARAEEAVATDGSKTAKAVYQKISACVGYQCDKTAEGYAQTSLVGSLSGRACRAVYKFTLQTTLTRITTEDRVNLLRAEQLAEQAMDEARIQAGHVETPKATPDTKASDEEKDKVKEAERSCQRIETRCQAACVAGDQFSCIAWAKIIWPAEPARYAQALNIMEYACGKTIQYACQAAKQIDADMAAYADETEALWTKAADAADSIATKRWQINHAKTTFAGKKNEKGIAMMEVYVAAVVAEDFCPAKRDFVARLGLAEFRHRAKVYCENTPAVVTGLSGSQVELRVECKAAFSSQCP